SFLSFGSFSTSRFCSIDSVVWFAICANQAADSRNLAADKQAARAVYSSSLAHYWLESLRMNARYALLNGGLDAPEHDAFARAFRGVPGLTAMDANSIGNPECGMLVRNLTLEQATALQSNLKLAGTDAEIVSETALPILPN